MKVLIDKQILYNLADQLRDKFSTSIKYFPIDYANLIKAIDDTSTGGILDLTDYFNFSMLAGTGDYYEYQYEKPIVKSIKKVPLN